MRRHNSPHFSRRACAAILSIGVNVALVLLACVPRASSSGQFAPAEERLEVSLLPVETSRPQVTLPTRPATRTLAVRRAFAATPAAARGPPTETVEALRARMAVEREDGSDGHPRALRCDGIERLLPTEPVADAMLSLHIGVDGRVLNVELDRSTGDPRADAALRECAASWGPFPLAIVDGRLLESWQRITWPATSDVRRL